MKRGKPPERDVEKRRAFERRSRQRAIERARTQRRKPIAARSKKRVEFDRARAEIKAAKLVEAGVVGAASLRPYDVPRACRGAVVWPEIFCGIVSYGRPLLELHELVKRSRWRAGALVAENCVLLCQMHHDATEQWPEEARLHGLLVPGYTRPIGSRGRSD